MNADAAYRTHEQKTRQQNLGWPVYRKQCLDNLDLKTVIKESHLSPVHTLTFNQTSEEYYNLFAAVSKSQATVYDDSHMGEHLAVILQYNQEADEDCAGGELQTCAWVNVDSITHHPHGDACLALAGADGVIMLLSIVESRITCLLKGHASSVIELAAAAHCPGLLASLAKDGNIRVWDVQRQTCMTSHASDATCLAVNPGGTALLTGGRRGALRQYSLPAAESQNSSQVVKIDGASHSDTLECIRFLSGSRVISRSCDGVVHTWDFGTRSHLSTFKVPSCSPGGGLASRCQLGHTPDGAFACSGNQQGHTYAWDTATGERLCHFPPYKANAAAPVRACGLSNDCMHLLTASGNGLMFRYETMEPDAEASDADDGGAGAADKMDQD